METSQDRKGESKEGYSGTNYFFRFTFFLIFFNLLLFEFSFDTLPSCPIFARRSLRITLG